MAILLFPGQGAQYEGMGKQLFDAEKASRHYFEKANEVLGFNITDVMFNGDAEALRQTSVTQPAVLLNSIVLYEVNKDKIEQKPTAVAGHSLGEITALIANDVLSFEDGLLLVQARANAMQNACNQTNGTMAAILGLENEIVEDLCEKIEGVVIAANYNCPGQLVISGEVAAVEKCAELAKEQGARRAIMLPVNGAFHSPLMQSAEQSLAEAIDKTNFNAPTIPIYQNVSAKAEKDPETIKSNLKQQLTSPVKWTQSMQQMQTDGVDTYIEFGAKVLSGFIKKLDRQLNTIQYL